MYTCYCCSYPTQTCPLWINKPLEHSPHWRWALPEARGSKPGVVLQCAVPLLDAVRISRGVSRWSPVTGNGCAIRGRPH